MPEDETGTFENLHAARLARLDRREEAREHMARLLAVDPGFSLDAERRTARFGDSPALQRYLADLAAAGAPEQPGGSA